MIFGGLNDEAWGEIEKMQDKLIGGLRFDIEFAENLLRKISQVAGHDDAGVPTDRGCQYMAILRVGEDIALDEMGYVRLAEVGTEMIFQVIADRGEKAAVIITTSLQFSERSSVFLNTRL